MTFVEIIETQKTRRNNRKSVIYKNAGELNVNQHVMSE